VLPVYVSAELPARFPLIRLGDLPPPPSARFASRTVPPLRDASATTPVFAVLPKSLGAGPAATPAAVGRASGTGDDALPPPPPVHAPPAPPGGSGSGSSDRLPRRVRFVNDLRI
jgi:hypothetical protein